MNLLRPNTFAQNIQNVGVFFVLIVTLLFAINVLQTNIKYFTSLNIGFYFPTKKGHNSENLTSRLTRFLKVGTPVIHIFTKASDEITQQIEKVEKFHHDLEAKIEQSAKRMHQAVEERKNKLLEASKIGRTRSILT